MDISLNGAPRHTASARLADLLTDCAIDSGKPGIAIAINDAIVPRAKWADVLLQAGDSVEIVRPHSGG